MKSLLQRISDIQNQSCINHIMVPRGVLLVLSGVVLALLLLVFTLWHGIWIMVAIPVGFVTILFVYLFWGIWKNTTPPSLLRSFWYLRLQYLLLERIIFGSF